MNKFGPDVFHHPLRTLSRLNALLILQGPVDYERRKVVGSIMDKFQTKCTLVSDITFKKHVPGPHSLKYDLQITVADEELADFYAYCRSAVEQAFQETRNMIIIDQSRIDNENFKYYVQLALKMRYVILMYPIHLDPEGPCNMAADESIGKSTMAMETESVQTELLNHLFCGWFLNESDTADLRTFATSNLMECFEGIDEFRNMLTEYLGEKGPKSHYNLETASRDRAFCAAKIVDDPLDFRRYTKTLDFKKHYGCSSILDIVGFVITPQTISARVRLTVDQSTLYEMPGDVDEASVVTVFPSEMLKGSKIDLPSLDVPVTEPDPRFEYDMPNSPGRGYIMPIHHSRKERSCHIALAKSDGASPRNVDYDVPFAVHKERIVFEDTDAIIETHDLENCVVRCIGNYWFVYPKKGAKFVALFATCCIPTNI